MPLKAKSRLTGPKRRRIARASNPEAPSGAGIAVPGIADADEDMEETHGRVSAAARLELFATLAWSTDYLSVLKVEAEENGAITAVPEHVSHYRQRQLQKSASRDTAFWKSALRISRDNERLRRERNVHYISFSQVLRIPIQYRRVRISAHACVHAVAHTVENMHRTYNA